VVHGYLEEELTKNPYTKVMTNVPTKISKCHDMDGKIVNRYEKSITMYSRIMLMFLQPDAPILMDMTFGTGTTAVAALEPFPVGFQIDTVLGFDSNPYQRLNARQRLTKLGAPISDLSDINVDTLITSEIEIFKEKKWTVKRPEKEKKRKGKDLMQEEPKKRAGSESGDDEMAED
jgi:hypothetical protein